MPDIIHLLSDLLANQIAAGEVVQRPASAVKEILENAIDAQATKIQVIVKDAGKSLIQVVDNGIGMSETDARMSLERHTTSKIKNTEDLFAIKTMGFRGEALASIAAVSQLQITTKQADSELGTSINIEASEIKGQEPVAVDNGTSVTVKNLFYNVPARRNFLKSNPVEMRHIVEDFQRIALSHPAIAFALYQNDLETYNLPPGKLSQRIVNIFGRNYQEQLASCKEETEHIKVFGYIGKPELAKKTRGEQFFFVNNRFIKNNYLNHAVLNAYEGLIPERSYPFYVIFIEIDPAHIDVNVHPTKSEIKFEDERTVYGVVRAVVKQALGTHNLSPSLDFGSNVNFDLSRLGQKIPERESKRDRDYAQFRNTSREISNLENWENLFEKGKEEALQSQENLANSESVIFESAANKEEFLDHHNLKESSRTTFQIQNQYIVTPVKSGMIIIDQQAAHERILFEKYLTNLENKNGSSQKMLFPQNVDLNISDFKLVMELEEEIKALGFIFEVFGKSNLKISGIPSDLLPGKEKELFEGLVDQFKVNKTELTIPIRENLSRSLAKRSAIKAGYRLDREEMNILIDNLFACSIPNYAPDGRSTFCIFDLNKIANYFK